MPRKPIHPEDPFEMIAQGVPLSNANAQRSMDEMTEALVDEYFRMGWPREEILKLFENPFYQLPHWIWQKKGSDYIRTFINRTFPS